MDTMDGQGGGGGGRGAISRDTITTCSRTKFRIDTSNDVIIAPSN